MGAQDRRQEAGVRADPARRHDASWRACSTSCRRRGSPISGSTAIPRRSSAVEYIFKAPADIAERLVIVVAPVLATANTAVAAIDRLKERGAKDIRFVCLIAAPKGVERLRGIHPDVPSGRPRSTTSRRARLHRAGPGRCRRPGLRHGIAVIRRRKACPAVLRLPLRWRPSVLSGPTCVARGPKRSADPDRWSPGWSVKAAPPAPVDYVRS